VLRGFLSFRRVFGRKFDEHVFQRRTYFMNLDMSDADFAQLFLDLRALDCVIDEQMHRLAEDCGAAHSGHLMHGVECRRHVIAGHVQPPCPGWIHLRQLFQLARR